ncbi:Fc.00g093690.m01.CDS01 [Cosmosporella sp. VM-42]
MAGPKKSGRVSGPSHAPEGTKYRDRWMWKGAGEVLREMNVQSIAPSEVAVSSGDGYELVCSYSWVQERVPTVYVPGDAPRYVQRDLPLYVPPDSGAHFIDQNGFQVPKYPFEVVFRATEVMNPTFKFDHTDVLINRNSLRKLLDFCLEKGQESFRVDLYTVSNTLIVERRESSTRRMIRGSGNTGRGHNFEQAFAQPPPDMNNIAGHHRVLQYKLGGLICAARFEVDATYDTPETGQSASDWAHPPGALRTLVEGIEALQVQSSGAQTTTCQQSNIQVIPRGIVTPHTKTAELKSSGGKHIRPSTPQLWFGRTPFLIRGYHTDGVFHNIDVVKAEDRFKAWETETRLQDGLRKLSKLLSELRDVVKDSKGRACMVIHNSRDRSCLKIFAVNSGRKPLPKDVIDKFWAGDTSAKTQECDVGQ